jgi:hypothetical protein
MEFFLFGLFFVTGSLHIALRSKFHNAAAER